jgi:hypothetical protein
LFHFRFADLEARDFIMSTQPALRIWHALRRVMMRSAVLVCIAPRNDAPRSFRYRRKSAPRMKASSS